MGSVLKAVEFTIANAAAVSNEHDLAGFRIVGIQMPADWTAANLTFQARPRTVDTLQNVFDDDGAEVVVTAVDDRYIAIAGATRDSLDALAFVKLRSGTAATPVNQAAARTVIVVIERR